MSRLGSHINSGEAFLGFAFVLYGTSGGLEAIFAPSEARKRSLTDSKNGWSEGASGAAGPSPRPSRPTNIPFLNSLNLI